MEMPWWDDAEKLWGKSPKCNPELISNSKDGASHSITVLDAALAGMGGKHPTTSPAPLQDRDEQDLDLEVEDNNYVASDGDDRDEQEEEDLAKVSDDDGDEEKFVSTPKLSLFSSVS